MPPFKQLGLGSPGLAGLILGAMCNLFLPAAAQGDSLTITPTLEIRQAFTDNIDLETDDAKEEAAITEIVPGLALRSETSRFEGAFDAFPIVRYQTAGDEQGFDFSGDLAGFGSLEVIDQFFFFDAEASRSQEVLDSRETSSTSNETDIFTYRLSPYIRHRFGGYAEGLARYRFSQVMIGDSGTSSSASDTTTHSAEVALQSGSDFTRFRWLLFGTGAEEQRSDDEDISRREVGVELEYVPVRMLGLIVGGGYQTFDDGEPSNEVDAPTWLAGVRWLPGPRTELRATIGQRNEEFTPDVKLTYKFSEDTRVTARYSKLLETSQERLERVLSNIALGAEIDDLIDRETEFAFNPNPSPFSIDDDTTLTEVVRIDLVGSRGRNSFGAGASYASEENLDTGETEDVITVNGRFSRELTRHLDLSLFGSYQRSEFDDGQIDDEYFASTNLSYRLSEDVSVGGGYSYRLQESNLATAEFQEHRVFMFIRKTF